MAAKVRLNNFRFSIYIDADGTVTLTDLPPELREVAEALDPSYTRRAVCPASHTRERIPLGKDQSVRQVASEDPA
jgi:hypothetical protein